MFVLRIPTSDASVFIRRAGPRDLVKLSFRGGVHRCSSSRVVDSSRAGLAGHTIPPILPFQDPSAPAVIPSGARSQMKSKVRFKGSEPLEAFQRLRGERLSTTLTP